MQERELENKQEKKSGFLYKQIVLSFTFYSELSKIVNVNRKPGKTVCNHFLFKIIQNKNGFTMIVFYFCHYGEFNFKIFSAQG